MDSLSLIDRTNYSISPNLENPESVELSGPDFTTIILHLLQISIRQALTYSIFDSNT
jgi:hypothetical protein